MVGAYALTMVACLLPDNGSLNVIRRSLMPLLSNINKGRGMDVDWVNSHTSF